MEERADALADGCEQFEKQAAALKSQFGMSPMMMVACGVGAAVVLGLLYWHFTQNQQPAYPPPYGYPPPPPPAPAAPAGGDTGGDAGADAAGDAGDSGE